MMLPANDSIQRMQDVSEIEALQVLYGHCFDKGCNGKAMDQAKLLGLFTDDASWECAYLGLSGKGRDEIAKIANILDAGGDVYMHFITNPVIEIDGNNASGKWLLMLGANVNGKFSITCGSYENAYVRTEEGWRIQAIRIHYGGSLSA